MQTILTALYRVAMFYIFFYFRMKANIKITILLVYFIINIAIGENYLKLHIAKFHLQNGQKKSIRPDVSVRRKNSDFGTEVKYKLIRQNGKEGIPVKRKLIIKDECTDAACTDKDGQLDISDWRILKKHTINDKKENSFKKNNITDEISAEMANSTKDLHLNPQKITNVSKYGENVPKEINVQITPRTKTNNKSAIEDDRGLLGEALHDLNSKYSKKSPETILTNPNGKNHSFTDSLPITHNKTNKMHETHEDKYRKQKQLDIIDSRSICTGATCLVRKGETSQEKSVNDSVEVTEVVTNQTGNENDGAHNRESLLTETEETANSKNEKESQKKSEKESRFNELKAIKDLLSSENKEKETVLKHEKIDDGNEAINKTSSDNDNIHLVDQTSKASTTINEASESVYNSPNEISDESAAAAQNKTEATNILEENKEDNKQGSGECKAGSCFANTSSSNLGTSEKGNENTTLRVPVNDDETKATNQIDHRQTSECTAASCLINPSPENPTQEEEHENNELKVPVKKDEAKAIDELRKQDSQQEGKACTASSCLVNPNPENPISQEKDDERDEEVTPSAEDSFPKSQADNEDESENKSTQAALNGAKLEKENRTKSQTEKTNKNEECTDEVCMANFEFHDKKDEESISLSPKRETGERPAIKSICTDAGCIALKTHNVPYKGQREMSNNTSAINEMINSTEFMISDTNNRQNQNKVDSGKTSKIMEKSIKEAMRLDQKHDMLKSLLKADVKEKDIEKEIECTDIDCSALTRDKSKEISAKNNPNKLKKYEKRKSRKNFQQTQKAINPLINSNSKLSTNNQIKQEKRQRNKVCDDDACQALINDNTDKKSETKSITNKEISQDADEDLMKETVNNTESQNPHNLYNSDDNKVSPAEFLSEVIKKNIKHPSQNFLAENSIEEEVPIESIKRAAKKYTQYKLYSPTQLNIQQPKKEDGFDDKDDDEEDS